MATVTTHTGKYTPSFDDAVQRTLSSKLEDVVSVSDFGVIGDGVFLFSGGSVSSGDTTFTHSSGPFSALDVGKLIVVYGAAAAGANLATTIAAVNDPTSIELSDAASTTVSNGKAVYGTDTTSAFNTAISSIAAVGGELYVPRGIFLHTGLTIYDFSLVDETRNTTRFRLSGAGQASRLVCVAASPSITIGGGATKIFDVCVEKVHLDGANIATNGISIDNASRITVQEARIYNHASDGIAILNDSYGPLRVINNIIRENGGNGILVDNSTANNGNNLVVGENAIAINGGAGIRLESSAQTSITENAIEANGNGGVYMDGSVRIIRAVTIGSNYFENHISGAKANIYAKVVHGLAVMANENVVSDNTGQLYGVYIDSVSGFAMLAETVVGVNATGTGLYVADGGNYPSLTVLGNYMSSLATRIRLPASGVGRSLISAEGYGDGIGPSLNGLEVQSAAPQLRFIESDQASGSDTVYVNMIGGALAVRNEAGTVLFRIAPYQTNPAIELGLQAQFRSYATVSRPTAYTAGCMIYDSTLKLPAIWNGSAWVVLAPRNIMAAISDLDQTISDPPTQPDVQALSDKVDQLLASLRTAGLLAT